MYPSSLSRGSYYCFVEEFPFYQHFDPAILLLGIYPKIVGHFSYKDIDFNDVNSSKKLTGKIIQSYGTSIILNVKGIVNLVKVSEA